MKRTIAPALTAALDRFTAYPERVEPARRELRALLELVRAVDALPPERLTERMRRALSRLRSSGSRR